MALRWRPIDAIDANLSYYYQDMDVGGRTENHVLAFGTGKYQEANRVLEPNERTNKLAALEINCRPRLRDAHVGDGLFDVSTR